METLEGRAGKGSTPMTDVAGLLERWTPERYIQWLDGLRGGGSRGEKRPIQNLDNRYEMTYADANAQGNIHGGEIIKRMDTVAGQTAKEYAGGPAVTASMDQAAFYEPVAVGDTLEIDAYLDYVGTTSMMVRVDAYVRDYVDDSREKTTAAYFTFVAIDDDGSPREVPELVLETEEEEERAERARQVKARLEDTES